MSGYYKKAAKWMMDVYVDGRLSAYARRAAPLQLLLLLLHLL